MPKESTKTRKMRQAERRRAKKRRERLALLYVGVALAVCVISFASIRLSNGNSAQRADAWINAGREVEILAPEAPEAPAVVTMDNAAVTTDRGGDDDTALPFLVPDPTDAPIATAEPRPTAVVVPTGMPELADVVDEPGDTVSITLTATGDITVGGDIPSGGYRYFKAYYDKHGPAWFLANLRELFAEDDITLINFEGTLTKSEKMRGGRAFNFRADPEYVHIFDNASVEIANLGNNHSLDYGETGFNDTVETLSEAGIGVSGFSKVYTTEIKGVTVCSIGFTEWDYTKDEIVRAVRMARQDCDLLIVSMHWGVESRHEATSKQKEWGRAVVDAGADVVIGNHPHVYGGVEKYKGKYIVYSLGNLCFGGNKDPRNKDCALFRQTFLVSADGTVSDGGIDIIPARISGVDDGNDYQPWLLSGDAAVSLLGKIAKLSSVDEGELVWMDDGVSATLLSNS